MKTENFEDIKEMLSSKDEVPESLSKENITKMLKEKNIKQKRKSQHVFLKAVAVAASVAVVLTSVFVSQTVQVPINYDEQTTLSAQENKPEVKYEAIDLGIAPKAVMKFQDEKDIKNYFLNMKKYDDVDDFIDGIFNDTLKFSSTEGDMAADMEAPGSALNTNGTGSASQSFEVKEESFSQTNTQVQGVDEADIVKNDGRFLYIISNQKRLTIIDTKDMSVAFSQELKAKDEEKTFFVREIYLNGDRLVAVGTESEKAEENNEKKYYSSFSYSYYYPFNSDAVTAVYDISEKSSPKLLRYITQDGEYLTSRMVGSYLYTVTEYLVNLNGDSDGEKYIPKIEEKAISVEDIYVADREKESRTYVVVSGYDTSDEKGEVSAETVLGSYSEVYCSQSKLYVADTEYISSTDKMSGRHRTNLYVFSLENGKVEFRKSGIVPGMVDNQFSMDENGGFFRIATTDYDYNEDCDISSLYVLDGELNVIGELFDIAKDEQIKSVRYMGNYAYVVTFRNTDPLFVIDLSKPDSPEMKGELKLPGFSEYLHPIGEGLLVGVGYDGDEESADFSSVKLSLFDVSDPEKPKEMDTHIIKGAFCEVNSDHKAFMTLSNGNTFGFPLRYDLQGGQSYQFKLMTVKDGKFTEKQNFAHPSELTDYFGFLRGAYIGKTLYTVTNRSVASFDLETAEMIESVVFYEEELPTEEIILTEGIIVD